MYVSDLLLEYHPNTSPLPPRPWPSPWSEPSPRRGGCAGPGRDLRYRHRKIFKMYVCIGCMYGQYLHHPYTLSDQSDSEAHHRLLHFMLRGHFFYLSHFLYYSSTCMYGVCTVCIAEMYAIIPNFKLK